MCIKYRTGAQPKILNPNNNAHLITMYSIRTHVVRYVITFSWNITRNNFESNTQNTGPKKAKNCNQPIFKCVFMKRANIM